MPAHEIIAAAETNETDLVVTGSRCLHGLDRWLLGGVARNVLLHATASVLSSSAGGRRRADRDLDSRRCRVAKGRGVHAIR